MAIKSVAIICGVIFFLYGCKPDEAIVVSFNDAGSTIKVESPGFYITNIYINDGNGKTLYVDNVLERRLSEIRLFQNGKGFSSGIIKADFAKTTLIKVLYVRVCKKSENDCYTYLYRFKDLPNSKVLLEKVKNSFP